MAAVRCTDCKAVQREGDAGWLQDQDKIYCPECGCPQCGETDPSHDIKDCRTLAYEAWKAETGR